MGPGEWGGQVGDNTGQGLKSHGSGWPGSGLPAWFWIFLGVLRKPMQMLMETWDVEKKHGPMGSLENPDPTRTCGWPPGQEILWKCKVSGFRVRKHSQNHRKTIHFHMGLHVWQLIDPSFLRNFRKSFFRPSSGVYLRKNLIYKGRGVEGVGGG